ncbi:MAG: hydrogenase maturation nickel metallochaperone HypA [Thermodesulfovibrionales bacterium]
MHEASLALSILDSVVSRCRDEGYGYVESVRLRIGRASGVLPEALAFAFDAAKEDTIARDAKLVIDIVPVGGFCDGCMNDFEVDDGYVLNCPLCGSDLFRVNKGYEMEIVEMDVK